MNQSQRVSRHSTKSIEDSSSYKLKNLYHLEFNIVFVMDGVDVSHPKTKSHKTNISEYLAKYQTEGMKDDRKEMFEERTFLELLEDISCALLSKHRNIAESTFKYMFGTDG
jgi:hypothetical protein